MGKFLAKRLVAMIVILLCLTAVLFILQQISPTDPVIALLGHAQPKILAAYRRKLGLDDPLIVQYFHYVANILHGNLGESYRTHDSVGSDLITNFPPTLELIAVAFVLAVILGTGLGILTAGEWRGSGIVRTVLLSAASAPTFLLGLLGILLFYHRLNWLPASGQTSYPNAPTGPTKMLLLDSLIHGQFSVFKDAVGHIILPALSLAIAPSVAIGRVLRSSLVYNLGQDYARSARARGLTEFRVVFKHALRNSLNGTLNMTGLQLGAMFASVVVIEEVFSWPGLGQYTALSIQQDDLPAILGVALLFGAIYIVANVIVDVLQVVADPRIAL